MSIKFHVPDMSCGHCKASIEKAVEGTDPLAELTFNMDTRHVEIDSDIDTDALFKLLKDAGFPATAL